jgi:phosphoribosylaminoimidazole-succinocarboxamide synthase
MSYQKGELLYEGKAKKIFSIPGQENLVWVEFKNSLTAFNAQKKGSFEGKGRLNCLMASLIFQHLEKNGVPTHLVSNPSDREMVCRKVEIIPLEVVVRNVLAGSTAKKFGLEEGLEMEKPLVEFYYKKDELNDPFISDDQALFIKAARSPAELEQLKTIALKVNGLLSELFKSIGIRLVDFKIEFGRQKDGSPLLADEISPDSCRLWDLKSGEKMDKDRFRRDLGKVEESYLEVWKRLDEKLKGQR